MVREEIKGLATDAQGRLMDVFTPRRPVDILVDDTESNAKFDNLTHWIASIPVQYVIGASSIVTVAAHSPRAFVKDMQFKTACTLEVM